ncbi:helix-turn-helix domain-containing protein [Streptomyces sp. TLI_146]|uniref:helix-turn-helix domain-containing protein n=1 Tax=Streptomyces sp. TLI_146 TaxID=1938858 RepID=UPI000C7008EE
MCRCGSHGCPPQGLTVAEAAARAGVTVQRWCRQGQLPAIQHGGRWIVIEPLPERVARTLIPRR